MPTHQPPPLPLLCCLSALLWALVAASPPPDAPTDTSTTPATWGRDDTRALLGVHVGMGCDAAMKTLGKTKYRFGYNQLKMFGYEALDHAMDVDVQCLSDAVASVSIRRILPSSPLAARWEARLLAAHDAGAQITATLPPPALTRDGTHGEHTRYDCTPDGHVIAWHLTSPSGPLRQALLITPSLLPPDVQARLSCSP